MTQRWFISASQSIEVKSIHVAAGVILRDGLVYLTKRALDAHQGGKWEFPGGKVELGESAQQGLIRELKEEVGIEVKQSQSFEQVVHDYPDKRVKLDFILVTEFAGEPSGCEGQLGRWFELAEISTLDFPKANQTIVDKLLA